MKRFGLIILVVAVLTTAVAYGVMQTYPAKSQTTNDTASGNENPPPEPTPETDIKPNPEPNSTPDEYGVAVYFASDETYNDPTKLTPVKRTTTDVGVAKFALSQLLLGPKPTDLAGLKSSVNLKGESNCDGADFTLKIADKVATLQFCRQLEHIGSFSDGIAEQQIRQTLIQFDTISRVIILNLQGDCEFDLAGDNGCKNLR